MYCSLSVCYCSCSHPQLSGSLKKFDLNLKDKNLDIRCGWLQQLYYIMSNLHTQFIRGLRSLTGRMHGGAQIHSLKLRADHEQDVDKWFQN